MANFPGLELAYSSVESIIKSNCDALICFVHWNLIQKGFKCTGKGENDTSGKKSELLPAGWNSSQEEYALRYVLGDTDDKFLLKCLLIGDTLLVNFMRLGDDKVTSLSLDIDQFIQKEQLRDFENVYKDKPLLHQMLSDDLIKPLKSKGKETKKKSGGSSSKQSETREERQEEEREGQRRQREGQSDPLRERDPLRDPDPLRIPPRLPGQRGNPEWGQPTDPFAVGHDDLDPFGHGGGGGMLMDPFRGGMPHRGIDPGIGMPGGRLPPGAVPPGARFDPIGPPRPGGPGGVPRGGYQGEPDPDHLPPPGYDDMFM